MSLQQGSKAGRRRQQSVLAITLRCFDNPPMRTRIQEIASIAAAALLFPSCVLVSRPNGIVVSSDPPGATVSIDRRDSGFVTPCVLEVDADDDKRVDIQLKGYEPETRL